MILAKMVQTIGDSIEENTKRSLIESRKTKKTYSYPISKLRKVGVTKRRRDSIQLDQNDSNSKITVPVTQQKLDKLLMFYYIKKKYPKLVDHLLETESKGDDQDNTGTSRMTVNLNESMSALEALSENSKLTERTGDARGEKTLPRFSNETTSVITPDQLKTLKEMKTGALREDRVDSLLSNLIDKEVGADSSPQARLDSLNIDLGEEGSNTDTTVASTTNAKVTNVHTQGKVNTTDGETRSKPSNLTLIETPKNNSAITEMQTKDTTQNPTIKSNDNATSSDSIQDYAKTLLKDVEELQTTLSTSDSDQASLKGDSGKSSSSNKPCTNQRGVGCMAKELVSLFDETFTTDKDANTELRKAKTQGSEESSEAETTNAAELIGSTQNRDSSSSLLPHSQGKTSSYGAIDLVNPSNLDAVPEIKSSQQINNNKGPRIPDYGDGYTDSDLFPGFFRSKVVQEITGETRKGGDPYASIGHNAFKHAENTGESVVANKYYDKTIGKFTFSIFS